MKDKFARLDVEASQSVLRYYRSRKGEVVAESELRRLSKFDLVINLKTAKPLASRYLTRSSYRQLN
jgi:hypothetical protein